MVAGWDAAPAIKRITTLRGRSDCRRRRSVAQGTSCRNFHGGGLLLRRTWDFRKKTRWRVRDPEAGRRASLGMNFAIGFLLNAQKISPAIPATGLGEPGKEFLLPFDSHGGSNRDGRSEPQAGFGSIPRLHLGRSVVSGSAVVFPPEFGGCDPGCFKLIPVYRQAGFKMAYGVISLNAQEKRYAIGPTVAGNSRKLLPLPLDGELGSNLDGSLDSNADSGWG